MKNYKRASIIVGVSIVAIIVLILTKTFFPNDGQPQAQKQSFEAPVLHTFNEVSIVQALTGPAIPRELLDSLPVMSPTEGIGSSLVSAGAATTTLKKSTPFNDIQITETASSYAGLRNARYTMWPYPGEILYKEIYLVLPDSYELLLPGYSNKQFLEVDGTKNIVLYIRHKSGGGVGADARIHIASPVSTREENHPIVSFDTTDYWEGFSQVLNGKEVVVEIILSPTLDNTPDLKKTIRAELSHAVGGLGITL